MKFRKILILLIIFIGISSKYAYSQKINDDALIRKGNYKSLGAEEPLKKIQKLIKLDVNEVENEFGFSYYKHRLDSENIIEIGVNNRTSYQMRFTGPKFKTDRGVKIGDTLEKVLKKYPDGVAEYSGDEGGYLVVIVKKENLIFSFNRDNIEAYDTAGKITDEFLNKKKLESILLRDLRKPLLGPVF